MAADGRYNGDDGCGYHTLFFLACWVRFVCSFDLWLVALGQNLEQWRSAVTPRFEGSDQSVGLRLPCAPFFSARMQSYRKETNYEGGLCHAASVAKQTLCEAISFAVSVVVSAQHATSETHCISRECLVRVVFNRCALVQFSAVALPAEPEL